jgi:hypothetical protein
MLQVKCFPDLVFWGVKGETSAHAETYYSRIRKFLQTPHQAISILSLHPMRLCLRSGYAGRGCNPVLMAGFSIKEVGMISVPCTLTLTDLEVTWLERVINNVIDDPSSNSNLRAEAEKLRRKLRDAQEDAVMESNRSDSWDEA